MKEGELIKRILGLKGAVLDSDYKKIVDDAKKEFPKRDKYFVTQTIMNEELMELKGRWFRWKAYEKDIQEWKKKWFGDGCANIR